LKGMGKKKKGQGDEYPPLIGKKEGRSGTLRIPWPPWTSGVEDSLTHRAVRYRPSTGSACLGENFLSHREKEGMHRAYCPGARKSRERKKGRSGPTVPRWGGLKKPVIPSLILLPTEREKKKNRKLVLGGEVQMGPGTFADPSLRELKRETKGLCVRKKSSGKKGNPLVRLSHPRQMKQKRKVTECLL